MLDRWLTACCYLLFACVAAPSAAETDVLERSHAVEASALDREQRAQESVARTDDERREIWVEHDALERELLALRAYREHLRRIRAGQQAKLRDLSEQIHLVAETRGGLIPLLLRMLDALGPIVSEPPFYRQERDARLADARAASLDSGLDLADQFRRVFAVYFAELDYANSIDGKRTRLAFEGEQIAGDLIRIGRLELYFIGLGNRLVLMRRKGAWQRLPNHYAVLMRRALRVASKRAAPAYLELPVRWSQGGAP